MGRLGSGYQRTLDLQVTKMQANYRGNKTRLRLQRSRSLPRLKIRDAVPAAAHAAGAAPWDGRRRSRSASCATTVTSLAGALPPDAGAAPPGPFGGTASECPSTVLMDTAPALDLRPVSAGGRPADRPASAEPRRRELRVRSADLRRREPPGRPGGEEPRSAAGRRPLARPASADLQSPEPGPMAEGRRRERARPASADPRHGRPPAPRDAPTAEPELSRISTATMTDDRWLALPGIPGVV